jgi:hypothetical protein
MLQKVTPPKVEQATLSQLALNVFQTLSQAEERLVMSDEEAPMQENEEVLQNFEIPS